MVGRHSTAFTYWARESVRTEITAGDGGRSVRLDRSAAAMELLETISGVDAVVVSGESGVGKSALAVLGLTAAGDAGPDSLRALCINLRQIPRLAIELEATLGCPLSDASVRTERTTAHAGR